MAVEITPVPRALVKSSASPGWAPRLATTRCGMDGAGDRVAELHLVIADGMAADHGAAGLDHLG